MGRLPALVIATVLLCACDSDEPSVPKQRTDAVTAAATATGATATTATTTGATAPAKKTSNLCQQKKDGDAPDGLEEVRVASGTAPGPLTFGGGRWVWLNVWAAWCEPCKKEMPTLLQWQAQLRDKGVKLELAFVSIDDDERELTRFLKKQPEDGVRTSYWLPEDAREDWFGVLGLGELPKLPVHAFVDPGGRTRCVTEGAVEEGDFAKLVELMGG